MHIARADYLGRASRLPSSLLRGGQDYTEDPGVVSFNDHPAMTAAGLGHSRAQTLKTLLRREIPENPHVGCRLCCSPTRPGSSQWRLRDGSWSPWACCSLNHPRLPGLD